MFCVNCGSQLPDDSRFCTNCGAPVVTDEIDEPVTGSKEESYDESVAESTDDSYEESEDVKDSTGGLTEETEESSDNSQSSVETAEVPVQTAQMQTPPVQTPKPAYNGPAYTPDNTKGRSSKKFPIAGIIAALAAVALIALALVLVFKFKKTEVDLANYLEAEYEGYDGFGRVNVKFNEEDFIKDYKGKIKPNKKLKSLIKEHDDIEDMADAANIKYSRDKDVCRLFAMIYAGKGALEESSETESGKLSNGDTLIYKWNIETEDMNEEEAVEFAKKAFNVKLNASDTELVVEDLEEIAMFDAFDGLDVEFTGVAPNATAKITDYPGDNGLSYSIENNSGLSNGDTVTVKASYNWYSEEDYAREYKRLPKEMTKEYKVEGLDEYITDISQISDADLANMKSETEDSIRKNIADQRKNYLSIDSIEYNEGYLLTSKSSNSSRKNMIVIIDRVKLKCQAESGKTDNKTYYFYAMFYDAVRTGNGEFLVDLTNKSVAYDGIHFEYDYDGDGWTESFYVTGYENRDQLFSEVITRNVEDFRYEQIPGGKSVASGGSDEEDNDGGSDAEPEDEQSEYVIPGSDERIISADELEGFSAEDCRYARNEIYARHGRKFDDAELQAYFESKSWYEGTIDAKSFKEDSLSKEERANIDTITEYEKKHGYR